MSKKDYNKHLAWLEQNPKLEELMQRYPDAWNDAGENLLAIMQSGQAQKLTELALQAKSTAEIWKKRIAQSGNNPKVVESALPHILRSRMSLLALDRCNLAAAAGKTTGKVRFNLLNGFIIQKLLFRRHLSRKPASLFWFRLWWPLVTQKRLLIPLVKDKGIYCFYTKELIGELNKRISGTRVLEIAAGDGTLSRFLCEAGTPVTATDDQSWASTIEYPAFVEKLDAKQALSKHQPETVICSWPPPGNGFERHVFLTKSVQQYIVIGSRYPFLSGNWQAYKEQEKFAWAADLELTRLVLPPELESSVLVFRRKV